LAKAARANHLEFLLEIIPSKVGEVYNETTAHLINRFYEIGIYPDWWKLEPMQSAAAWEKTCAAISKNDPYCRGIIILGLDAPLNELEASFKVAAQFDLVKGFAVGRSVFSDAAKAWFSGAISDSEAVKNMAGKYQSLCDAWERARALGDN
jgi:5-dehydro-2-deoxygluconokinase